jgi:DedD protein
MKDIMKKRVVGAAVLITLGVALPLMLARCMQDGDPEQDSMRVYEVAPDGETRPAGGAPADGGRANAQRAQVDGSSGVPESEDPETPQMPEAVSPSSEDESPASTEPGPAPEPEQTPEPAASASAASPESESASDDLRQRESFAGGYVVQVASFSDEANARKLANELNAEFKAFYRAGDVNGTTYYRVRVGPFENEESANAAAAQLRRNGRATLVRRAE